MVCMVLQGSHIHYFVLILYKNIDCTAKYFYYSVKGPLIALIGGYAP